MKVTPEGRVPDSESVGAGEPVAVTVNEAAVPTAKVVLLALVIAGASSTEFTTVRVKLWVATTEVFGLLKATMPAVQGAEEIVNPAATGAVAELS